MQLSTSSRHDRALTLIDVIIVLFILALLATVLLRTLVPARRESSRVGCIILLKEIGLAARVWEGDHNDHHLESLSVTNGGAMELLATGNVAGYFQVMSNDLSTPRILTCPDDTDHVAATNFYPSLKNTNISYFVALNANDAFPQTIMFGDDNLAADGVPVKSGLMNLWTNRLVTWTAKRHHYAGNVALADGSVEQLSNFRLTNALSGSGTATNLIVIP